MAHKTRWQHLPPRTRDIDRGERIRQHNERLAKDTALVVMVVKNVRPTKRGDGSAPFILVGTYTRLMDGLRNEYGYDFVGEPVLVTTFNGMDVRQVCVMSSLDKVTVDTLCSQMGYDGYDAWRANLLTVERNAKDDMPVVWYDHRVLQAQVPARMDRWFRVQGERIMAAAEALENAPPSLPYGDGGRVPAVTYCHLDVHITR